MRIKLILVATVVAALAIGVVSSNAALQTSTSVNVKLPKAGAPATVVTEIVNNDNAGLVPQRVSAITIALEGLPSGTARPFRSAASTDPDQRSRQQQRRPDLTGMPGEVEGR